MPRLGKQWKPYHALVIAQFDRMGIAGHRKYLKALCLIEKDPACSAPLTNLKLSHVCRNSNGADILHVWGM